MKLVIKEIIKVTNFLYGYKMGVGYYISRYVGEKYYGVHPWLRFSQKLALKNKFKREVLTFIP